MLGTAIDEHPDLNELIAFGQGRLNSSESSQIEGHLDTCDECCKAMLNVPDDGLMRKVRLARNAFRRRDTQLANSTAFGIESGVPTRIPPELVGHSRYQILGHIGQGGMGEVFRAKDTVMNRAVAVKVLNPQLVRNLDARERFAQEVQAAARLSHPNIVTAFDAEVAGTAQYLVMEYVEGENLADVVRERGPLSVQDACAYISQAADGLQHACEQGMVHRDIKPHNLMLENRAGPTDASGGAWIPKIRILDFGLSRFVSESGSTLSDEACVAQPVAADASTRLTRHTTLMGTADYISPEQARDARSADIRSDIYSLGCTLFFLLTGQPPFPEQTPSRSAKFQRTGQAPRLSEFRGDVSDGLDEVIERMIAAEPADRFSEPAEVVAALAPYTSKAARERDQARLKSRRFRVFVSAVVGLLAAGVIVVLKTGDGTIEIESPGSGMVIAIDDKPVEDGRRSVTVKLGRHDIEVRDADGVPIQRDTITIRWRGSTVAVTPPANPRSPVLTLSEADESVAFPDPIRTSSLIFDPSGEKLIAARPGGNNARQIVSMLDMTGNQQPVKFTPRGRSQGINAMTLSRDGRFLFLVNYDHSNGELTRIDLETGQTEFCPLVPDARNIWAGQLALTPNGNRLVVLCGMDNRTEDLKNDSVAVIDVSPGQFRRIASIPMPDEPRAVAVSDDRAWILAKPRQHVDWTIHELRLTEPQRKLRILALPESDLRNAGIAVCASRSKLFVSDSASRKIRTIDTETLQPAGHVETLAGIRPGRLAMSPDESLLAVLAPEHRKLWCINSHTGEPVGGASALPESPVSVRFSYDGRRLVVAGQFSQCQVFSVDHLLRRYVFASTVAGGASELYAGDVHGKQLFRLTRNGATNLSPRWSPDGRTIAYITSQSGPYRIATVSRDGSRERVWERTDPAAENANLGSLDWSPDGRQIAFIARDWNRVRLLDVESGDVRTLASAPDEFPDLVSLSWSKTHGILVTVEQTGNALARRLLSLDPNTGKAVDLLVPPEGWTADSPALSPDGTQVAARIHDFQDNSAGGIALFRFVDGRFNWAPQMLTLGKAAVPHRQFDPRWSADGRSLVWWSQSDGKTKPRIWTIKVDGSGRQAITSGEHSAVHPDVWQHVPAD